MQDYRIISFSGGTDFYPSTGLFGDVGFYYKPSLSLALAYGVRVTHKIFLWSSASITSYSGKVFIQEEPGSRTEFRYGNMKAFELLIGPRYSWGRKFQIYGRPSLGLAHLEFKGSSVDNQEPAFAWHFHEDTAGRSLTTLGLGLDLGLATGGRTAVFLEGQLRGILFGRDSVPHSPNYIQEGGSNIFVRLSGGFQFGASFRKPTAKERDTIQ